MGALSEPDTLAERDELVTVLSRALVAGEHDLKLMPQLVRRVIETEAWRERRCVRLRKPVRFDSFVEFITTPPLEGLGATIEQIAALIRHDVEAERMFREATTAPKHIHGDASNVSIKTKPKHGTSRAYTLDRLHREAPELYARVVAKELSPHAAAITAGFRKPTVSIEATPAGAGGDRSRPPRKVRAREAARLTGPTP